MNLHNIRNNKTLVNGGLFTLYSFFIKGIGFLLLVLLAGYICPAEYGYLSLYSTITMFLTYFIDMSTSGYLSISYFKDDEKDFKSNFTSIIIITSAFTIIICLLFGLAPSFFSNLLELPVWVIWVSIAVTVSGLMNSILQNLFRIKEKVVQFGKFSCSYAISNFFFSILFVIYYQQSWYGRVYAEVLTNVIFSLIAVSFFLRNHLFTYSGISYNRFKMLLLWGIPIIPHLASVWITKGCDRYIINSFHSIDDVGIFSFALNLVSVISIFGGAFNSTNSVTLSQIVFGNQPSEQKKIVLAKQTKMIFKIYVFVAVVFPIIASILVYLLLPKYHSSLPYFFILCVSGFMNCLYTLYCNYLFFYSKTKNLFYITFTVSLIHLLLSYVLTRYSIYFTAIAYVVCDTIVTICVWSYAKKLLRIHLR